MSLSETWCQHVSESTGWTSIDVRSRVNTWRQNGRSFDYIKRVLIITALAHGKYLCFVSHKGKN